MSERVGYRVDELVKEEFDKHIESEYGHKRNRCGAELEKAMKLYLALKGDVVFRDDPEVKCMIEKLQGAACTHTEDGFRPKRGDMDMFAATFKQEYGDRTEVSRSELSYFASLVHGVTDNRSISNRITYLVSMGILEPYAPNVFSVKKEEKLGFR